MSKEGLDHQGELNTGQGNGGGMRQGTRCHASGREMVTLKAFRAFWGLGLSNFWF